MTFYRNEEVHLSYLIIVLFEPLICDPPFAITVLIDLPVYFFQFTLKATVDSSLYVNY